MTKTLYVVIKLKVDVDKNQLPKDKNKSENDDYIADAVSSECDYTISYDQDGIKIVDSEMIGVSYENPS
jgi:hypothetical protein